MFFVYDANGKQFKMNNKVDQISALATGKYSEHPPGAPKTAPPVKLPEGERFEGIVQAEKEADAPDVKEDSDATERAKKIRRK